MSSPVLVGQRPSDPVTISRSKKSKEGIVEEVEYEVLNTDVDTFIASLGDKDFAIQRVKGSPFSRISVKNSESTDTAAILSDTWRLSYQEEEVDPWNITKVEDELAKASAEQVSSLRSLTDAYISGERTFIVAGDEQELNRDVLLNLAISAGMDTDIMTRLIDFKLKGGDKKVYSHPAIERQVTLPKNTSLEPFFTNVDKVYTTEALIRLEPTMWAGIKKSIRTHFPVGYWLVKSPTAEQQEDGKWKFTSAYWHTPKYSSFLYDLVS